MNDHHFFLREALREAGAAGDAGEVPVGAVLVGPDGTILGRGRNRSIGSHDPTAHAEVEALRQGARTLGNYRLTGTTLYVTVEPCVMCAGALVWARVAHLVYGAPDPRGGAVESLYNIPGDERLNHRVEVLGGILEEDCRRLMQEFFRKRRSTGGREAPGNDEAEMGGEVPKRS